MQTYRTLLEQIIRERRQTFEEFVESVEMFAREHKEPGTLGVRHLQRLVAGRQPDGSPLHPVKATTARLLEHMLGLSVDELLAPPNGRLSADDSEAEFRQRLNASSQVDESMLKILRGQLDDIRRVDRQFGAIVAHDEVRVKGKQVAELLTYCVSTRIREPLAALLSEFYCLAGWQALDMGRLKESWQHYENAASAAAESRLPSFMALAQAGRVFVMTDIGKTGTAVDLAIDVLKVADQKCSTLLRAWLASASGEALAADGQGAQSLYAFDKASGFLRTAEFDPDEPYVALDQTHLARWRGYALAKYRASEAIDLLWEALRRFDSTFVRAETALRVDLATALAAQGEPVAAQGQIFRALQLAEHVGSTRQVRRIAEFRARSVVRP